ncbi:tetr bacterial regulatory protein hth signature [Lucifera butyrica]|uniref:Tetr bacterial regulatory protein hth signature n=1 Tax=Lucifera butyrica TaxID=1351585 RepID=A0A498R154_9FIRM|nr:TetR/AcrR family transcriptional regulator [Lucifera butyrica]VBB05061.1 tetr bacterial regulatory protein hth signature [Lucifera butyrica]
MLVETNIGSEQEVTSMTVQEAGTADKILTAALELMSQKGYRAVTMREIAAAAGVCEMTVFRHFGNKRRVLEAAVLRHSYALPMKKIFAENIVWDLEQDLLLISHVYRDYIKRNISLILLFIKESDSTAELRPLALESPRQLASYLTDYFRTMQAKGKIIPTNAQAQAVAFLAINFGFYFSALLTGREIINLTDETFIETSVRNFCRGLQA